MSYFSFFSPLTGFITAVSLLSSSFTAAWGMENKELEVYEGRVSPQTHRFEYRKNFKTENHVKNLEKSLCLYPGTLTGKYSLEELVGQGKIGPIRIWGSAENDPFQLICLKEIQVAGTSHPPLRHLLQGPSYQYKKRGQKTQAFTALRDLLDTSSRPMTPDQSRHKLGYNYSVLNITKSQDYEDRIKLWESQYPSLGNKVKLLTLGVEELFLCLVLFALWNWKEIFPYLYVFQSPSLSREEFNQDLKILAYLLGGGILLSQCYMLANLEDSYNEVIKKSGEIKKKVKRYHHQIKALPAEKIKEL
jgi:hypothetical protein